MYSLLVAAGYPALAIAVLLGAFGAPLPLGVVLAAAGALARQGRLDLVALFLICALAAIAGDCLGYAAGRFGLRRLPLPGWAVVNPGHLERAVKRLGGLLQHMGMAVFLTRWAFTAPAPFINVLAGIRRYPLHSFLFADLAGEALWCATALAPGYLLGATGTIALPLSIAAGIGLAVAGALASRYMPAGRDPVAVGLH